MISFFRFNWELLDFLLVLIILQSLAIISSKSTITSILILINIYLIAATCYLLIGAEFIALSIIIIYVGAISILFLFIIMMLNIRIIEIYNNYVYYIPIISIIGIFFIYLIRLLVDLFYTNEIRYEETSYSCYNDADWTLVIDNKNNIIYIGEILYYHFFYLIIFAGLILLLAMVGSIALTVDYDYHQSRNKILNNYFISKSYKKRITFSSVNIHYKFIDHFSSSNVCHSSGGNKNIQKNIYE